MKNISVLVIFLMLNITLAISDETISTKPCTESNMEGAANADQYHSSAGWWAGGIGSGVVLGLIGTGIIWGVSMASNPQPANIPQNVDENCFRQGYKNEAKGENKVGAGVGGLIGTAVFIVIYLSIISANSH